MTFLKEVVGSNIASLFKIIKAVFPVFICAFITHLIAFADFLKTPKDSEKYKSAKSMFKMSAILLYVPILTLFIPIIYVQIFTFPVICVIAFIKSIEEKSKMSAAFLITGIVMIAFAVYMFIGISAGLSI